MSFKNLPVQQAEPLASLINVAPGQVSSMGLTQLGDAAAIALLAFAEGESVAEEIYPGDTLYYLVEGQANITLPDRAVSMQAGDVFVAQAGIEHAVSPTSAIKLLQINLP